MLTSCYLAGHPVMKHQCIFHSELEFYPKKEKHNEHYLPAFFVCTVGNVQKHKKRPENLQHETVDKPKQ